LTALVEAARAPYVHDARLHGAEYRGAYSAMYLIAPLTVWCGVAATDGAHHSRLLSGVEFLLILTILMLFLVMKRSDWQGRWVQSRRTAEHLRYLPLVAPFIDGRRKNWYDDVARRHGTTVSADAKVTRVCGELVHTEAVVTMRAELSNAKFNKGFRRYFDEILTEQIQYHTAKAAAEHALARRISVASIVLFVVTLVCTALLFFKQFVIVNGIAPYLPSLSALRHLATVLPAIGGGLRGLLAQSESHRVAKLSEGTALRLAQLQRELRELSPESEPTHHLEKLVWAAVQEMLAEADTWLRLQESVPLSLGG
jgi:CHASE3 domain sensor protein